MNKAKQNEADATFILERIRWYLEQEPRNLLKYFNDHPRDAWCTIPYPQRGPLIVGSEANQRFFDIAERYLAGSRDNLRKTDLKRFIECLKEEFSLQFAQQSKDISERNVTSMISSAFEKTSLEFETITHFIPCDVFLVDKTKEFSVGPVRFLHRSKFMDEHKSEIEEERARIYEFHRSAELARTDSKSVKPAEEDYARRIADGLIDKTLEFYSLHDWIAIVRVEECHPEKSRAEAAFAVKAALNILKLILGEYYTDRLRTAYDSGRPRDAAQLERRKDDKLHVSISRTPGGNVGGDEKLSFIETHMKQEFELACSALEATFGSSQSSPLCNRYIDALSWYGDAVTEESQAAKVVKFVNAIERMTGTGIEKDKLARERGIAETVSNRSSILCHVATDEPLEQIRAKIKRLYSCRSKLVHGSLSPFDDSIDSDAAKAEEISRFVLLMGLEFFYTLGIADATLKDKKLRGHYQNLERRYELLKDSATFLKRLAIRLRSLAIQFLDPDSA